MRLKFCASCGVHLDQVAPCTCPSCGTQFWRNPKPGGSAFVVLDGRVLLIRRAHDSWAGAWEVPGGFCEPEEHPADTAKREVFEETGVKVRTTGLLGTWIDTYGHDDPPDVVLSIYFLAEPIDAIELSPSDEVSELGWFGADEIPAELAFPAKLQPAVAAWRSSLLREPPNGWSHEQ